MLTRRRGSVFKGLDLLLGGVLLLGVAFSIGSSGVESEEHPLEIDVHRGLDWDNPIAGVSVDSFDEAQAAVTFGVLVPQSLGTPTDILVTDFPPQPESVVAFIYDHPLFGRVVVQEHIPDVDPSRYVAGLQEIVEISKRPTAQGTAVQMSVRGGDPALLTTSEDGLSSELWWLHDSTIEVIVRGPTLDRAACLAIAELI